MCDQWPSFTRSTVWRWPSPNAALHARTANYVPSSLSFALHNLPHHYQSNAKLYRKAFLSVLNMLLHPHQSDGWWSLAGSQESCQPNPHGHRLVILVHRYGDIVCPDPPVPLFPGLSSLAQWGQHLVRGREGHVPARLSTGQGRRYVHLSCPPLSSSCVSGRVDIIRKDRGSSKQWTL